MRAGTDLKISTNNSRGSTPTRRAVQKATADFLARDGRGDASVSYWERAEQLDPHDGDTASRLGEEFLRTGRTRDAYRQFLRAVDAQPDSAAFPFPDWECALSIPAGSAVPAGRRRD